MVVYEGSKYVIQIKSELETPVPYAKLTLSSDDGYYRVFNADEKGYMDFTLPLGNRSYNYSLSAHNMVYNSSSFSVDIDNKAPMIEDGEFTPNNPKADDIIHFNMTINDHGLGICLYILPLSSKIQEL